MGKTFPVFFIICIVTVLLAGCTASTPSPGGVTNTTTPILAVTTVPVDNQTCTRDADCVPAQCCHPTSCVNQASIHVCNFLCTASCERPLDCGAGSCGCNNGRCVVVPSASPTNLPQTSLQLTASPQRYAPIMSSTPGIGIELNASGFDPANATFTWNATYGHFLSWGPVNFTVQEWGNAVTNHSEKIYWSYLDKPASTLDPVIITVTATDPPTGRVLGKSTLTLAWVGNTGVVIRNTS